MCPKTMAGRKMRGCFWVLLSVSQAALIFCGAGCAEGERTLMGGQATSIFEQELREALDGFGESAAAAIGHAALELDERIATSRVRKTNLLWRIRSSQAYHAMLDLDDPVEAFVETWGLCVRLRLYFESGEGSALYGEHQQIALDASRQNEAAIEEIGTMFLTDDVLAETRNKVLAFARAHPIRGTFSKLVVYATEIEKGQQNTFAKILTVPLAPFRAVGGVDRGAAAIEKFTGTADRFSDIVEELPESTRWQSLLLLYDMQETEVFQEMLANVARVSESSSRLAETAEKLPERLRKETSLLVEQIDARQANLQVTLEKAGKSAGALERAAAKVSEAANSMQGVSKGVNETAQAWEEAARATTQLVAEYGKVAPPDNERPPFKIEDYKATAEAAAMTAIELRALVTELREMSKTGELPQYGSAARALMNDVTWRLGGLLLTLFVLAAIYKTVFGRATRATRAD